MRLHDWTARLSAHIEDTDIRGAADLAAARDAHQRNTVYVMYQAEDAEANRRSCGVQQRVLTDMLIVLAACNRRGTLKEELVTELEALRGRVRSALLGWTPPGAAGPVVFRSGQLTRLSDAVIWWQDVYRAEGWIEGTGGDQP